MHYPAVGSNQCRAFANPWYGDTTQSRLASGEQSQQCERALFLRSTPSTVQVSLTADPALPDASHRGRAIHRYWTKETRIRGCNADPLSSSLCSARAQAPHRSAAAL